MLESIAQAFPYVLIALSSLALIFHPVPGARAILFFTFGYFFTESLYSLHLFEDYGSRYHPLIIASALTIMLYHSLDITWGILGAWLTELFLIALNLCMVWNSGISTSLHWNLTVVSNMVALGLLIGNWWHGSGWILYSRFFDLDLPIGVAGLRYRSTRSENQGMEAKAKWK